MIKNGDGILPVVRFKGFNTLEEAQQRWDERLANEPGLRARVEAQQNRRNDNNIAPPSPNSHNRNNSNNVSPTSRLHNRNNTNTVASNSARSQNNPTGSSGGNGHGTRNNLRSHHSYPSPSPSVVSQALPTRNSGRSASRGIQRANTSPANSEPRATLNTSFSTPRGVSDRTRSWAAQTNPASPNIRELRQDRREDVLPNALSRGQGTVNSDRGSNHQVRPRASVESSFSDQSAITVSSDSSSDSESDRSISMVSHQRSNASRATLIRRVPPMVTPSTHRRRVEHSQRDASVVANSDAERPPSSPRTPSARSRASKSVSSRAAFDVPPAVSSPSRGSVRSSGRNHAAERLQEQSIVNSAPDTPRGSPSRSLQSALATTSLGVQTVEHSKPHECQCRHGNCRHHCSICLRSSARSSAMSNIGFSEPPHVPSIVIMDRDPRSPVASGSTLVPAQVGG